MASGRASALLLLLVGASAGFSCPDNRQCYCFEESAAEYRVHCATGNGSAAAGFDLMLQRRERLVVECANAPDWADFMLGSPIDAGPARSLVFTSCAPPGPAHAQRVAKLLGVSGVETLKFVILNGTLAREDLAAYPELKNLILSNNDMANVSVDLLRGTDELLLAGRGICRGSEVCVVRVQLSALFQ